MTVSPCSPMTKTWEVSVNVNGETVLTIGSNHLSGADNIDDHIDIIQNCGRHLTSFIGRPHAPASSATPAPVGEIVRELRAMMPRSFGPEGLYKLIERAADALQTCSADSVDAARYRRLQILGCAPAYSKQLEQGSVLRFTNLDEFVDADLKAHPSRGEAVHAHSETGSTP